MPSPFRQLQTIAERCLAELGSRRLRPQEIWLSEDPERLEEVKQAMLRLVGDLASGLHHLSAITDPRFAGVKGLDEWRAITEEAQGWKREMRTLRPAADTGHVKESLIAIRGRVSELLDALAVRAVVRDPANEAANSTQAARTIEGLAAERDYRELGLGLLEDGAADPWQTALEALDASVVDWSTRLGPEHRVQLEQLCHTLLEHLEALGRVAEPSPAVAKMAAAAGRHAEPLTHIYQRLLKVPAGKMDAGVASDFHYMASLAKRLVKAVRDSHGAVIADHAGKTLPQEVVDLFQLLHLAVPRVRSRTGTATLSRREIELAFGRRLWHGAEKSE